MKDKRLSCRRLIRPETKIVFPALIASLVYVVVPERYAYGCRSVD